jgi:hypothetical protein
LEKECQTGGQVELNESDHRQFSVEEIRQRLKAPDVGGKESGLTRRCINPGRGALMNIEEYYCSRETLNTVGGGGVKSVECIVNAIFQIEKCGWELMISHLLLRCAEWGVQSMK